jgi:hypothetical protein
LGVFKDVEVLDLRGELVAHCQFIGIILAVIVKHHNLFNIFPDILRNPPKDLSQRSDCVVSNDQNAYPFTPVIGRDLLKHRYFVQGFSRHKCWIDAHRKV